VSYKQTITITTAAVIVLHALLLSLGLRQYMLCNRYQEVVRQAEKTTFQFVMIREFILESLFNGQGAKLPGVTRDLEELGGQASTLLQSAAEINQGMELVRPLDLSSLILLLKGMGADVGPSQTQQLNRELRDLGDRILLLDRSLVQQARQQLVQLQHFIIGALAIITSALFLVLLRLYRKTFAPLTQLTRQFAAAADNGLPDTVSPHWSDPTLTALAAGMRHCLLAGQEAELTRQSRQQALDAIEHARNQLGQAGSRDKILKNCCRALLSNPAYCLAWIGLADQEGKDVVPISADASTSMTRDECANCMTVLLTAAEENGLEFNPAARALQGGQPVLQADILANTPRGLLKNTPLADGQAVCAAFPLRWQGENLGALSLYATSSASFAAGEMALFAGLAESIAMTLHLLRSEEEHRQAQRLLVHLLQHSEEFLALLDENGTITASGTPLRRLRTGSVQDPVGRHWSHCFQPSEQRDAGLLNGTPASRPQEPRLLALNCMNSSQRWRCRLIPLADETGGIQHYGLWGQVQQGATLETSTAEQECASMLPILGRITASTAHDIRDVASGIINYAQLGQDNSPQSNEIFEKILKAGERMADVARALVFYGQQEDAVEEFLPVSSVLADTVKLLSSLCHNEHIRLDVSQQDDLSRCHLPARPLQQILCTLLLRGRRALNSRYPGVDGRKRLHIQARTLRDGGEELLEITVTDWGVAVGSDLRAAAAGCDIPQRERTSALAISRCRQLAQALGGQLRVSEQPNSNSMILTLPLQHAPEHHIMAASDDTP